MTTPAKVFVYALSGVRFPDDYCNHRSPSGRFCDRILGHTGRHHATGEPVGINPPVRWAVAEVWS